MNAFERVTALLAQHKTVYFHYCLMGCGHITKYNPKSNTLSMKDGTNKHVRITEKWFNSFMDGVLFEDCIKEA
jgi:hypothetical protein